MRTIDVDRFCLDNEVLDGVLDAHAVPRVAAETLAIDTLRFRVEGHRLTRNEEARYALHPALDVTVEGGLTAPCQRCLSAVHVPIAIRARYVFFATEPEADAAAMQDDDLNAAVVDRRFDLDGLLEDEVLLALEDAARHAVCPPEALAALGLQQVGDVAVRRDQGPSAFAALAPMKKQ